MDESKAGHCLWITNRQGMEYWPSPSEEAKYLIRSSRFRRRSDFKAPSIKPPESFEKMCVLNSLLLYYIHALGRYLFPISTVLERVHLYFKLTDLLTISSHNFINLKMCYFLFAELFTP